MSLSGHVYQLCYICNDMLEDLGGEKKSQQHFVALRECCSNTLQEPSLLAACG